VKVVVVGYGSRGDLEPLAAVARELLRRGHDVCMTASPDRLGFVRSAGLTAVSYGPDSQAEMDRAAHMVRNLLPRTGNPFSMMIEVAKQVGLVKSGKSATLTPLAEGADAIVAGFNEQGLAAIVAEYYGIPLTALHYFPARISSSGDLYAAVTQETEDNLRRALGLSEAAGPTQDLLEIQAYDELSLPGPAAEWVDPGGNRPFLGALTLEMPTDADEEVLSWIAAGTPPIYFGFGSTPVGSPAETFAMISAACAQLGERALICGGPNDVTGIPDSETVKVVGAVNHAAILPACHAAVHHGGAGTTAAALRAGIPMLVLWFWLDQPVWAAGVERLKVGVAREFSASSLDTLVADLRAILAPECSARAREVAGQMTKADESVSSAADLVEAAVR
jgi:UDP:flavonoid glycosyltransferase YjiC (YdhE family)